MGTGPGKAEFHMVGFPMEQGRESYYPESQEVTSTERKAFQPGSPPQVLFPEEGQRCHTHSKCGAKQRESWY